MIIEQKSHPTANAPCIQYGRLKISNLTIQFIYTWIQLKLTKLNAFHETYFALGSEIYTNLHICVFSLVNTNIRLDFCKL